jgi:hypothetical protein
LDENRTSVQEKRWGLPKIMFASTVMGEKIEQPMRADIGNPVFAGRTN